MLTIFFVCFIIIIIALLLRLAGIPQLITSPHDDNILKEMDQKINAFENEVFSTPDEKEKAKRQLKRELIELKAKISFKKKEAEDKISLI